VIVILLGPPGAGKGTQAAAISRHLGIPHVSTGDIFRANLSEGTPLGLEAKGYMAMGELVPDDLVVRLVADRLSRPDAAGGALLDGFPRTVGQAEALEDILASRGSKVDVCLLLDVPDADLLARLSGRRVCRRCGSGWHASFSPPPGDLKCPKCGGEIYQRDDDREETVTSRLAVYRRQTRPLTDWYGSRGSLRVVHGTGTPQDVEKDIEKALSAGGAR
jgi:adenylate kinase